MIIKTLLKELIVLKKRNRILSGLMSLVLIVTIFSVMAVPAIASSTGESSGQIWAFYDSSFSSAWELYHSGDSGRASLTYGYNTWMIHEDYAWANHSTNSHKANIGNPQSHSGPVKPAGAVSKIEVTHVNPEVFYFCMF